MHLDVYVIYGLFNDENYIALHRRIIVNKGLGRSSICWRD
jgi:hypothetical protein